MSEQSDFLTEGSARDAGVSKNQLKTPDSEHLTLGLFLRRTHPLLLPSQKSLFNIANPILAPQISDTIHELSEGAQPTLKK